jgi:hypothetical protein
MIELTTLEPVAWVRQWVGDEQQVECVVEHAYMQCVCVCVSVCVCVCVQSG